MAYAAWICGHCRLPFPSQVLAEHHEKYQCREAAIAELRAEKRALLAELEQLIRRTRAEDERKWLAGAPCTPEDDAYFRQRTGRKR